MIGSRQGRRFRLLALFGVLAAAVLALTACGSSSSDSSSSAGGTTASSGGGSNEGSSTASSEGEGPFSVLAIMAQTGPFELPGNEELVGFEAAANVINSEGGILGHEVKLTVRDDQAEGNKAVSIAQEEVGTEPEKYNLIIPGISGSDAIPLAAQLASNPTLQITTASETELEEFEKYPNLYSSLNSFRANSEGVMEELEKEGIKKFAFIGGEAPSAESSLHFIEEAAEEHGITMTGSVLVPEENPDATPQMQKVLATHPEALVSGAFTLAAPAITKARKKLAPTMPWFVDTFFDAINFGEFAKPSELNDMYMQSFPFLIKGDPTQKEPWYETFNTATKKLEPKPKLALISQVVSYNALMIARAAAEKAESIEGPKMAEVMSEITQASEVEGFVGTEDTGIFGPEQHGIDIKGKNLVFTNAGVQEDGLLVPNK